MLKLFCKRAYFFINLQTKSILHSLYMKDKLVLVLVFMTFVMTYADGFSYKYFEFTSQEETEKSIAVKSQQLTLMNGTSCFGMPNI